MPRVANLFCALCIGVLGASGVNASALHVYESPVEQVSVLELYTSHGCSSCPPADAWLGTLTDRPGLWSEFIPLAFHVDYWDDLGWPDRFASEAFSSRQREYWRQGHLSSVYTPGFLVRGREWRGWFRDRALELTPSTAVGRLSLELHDGQRALIRFTPQDSMSRGQLTAHLAMLGFGLTTDVGGGENRGRNLKEDFVVLGYRSSGQTTDSEWDLALPDVVPAKTTRRAIIGWVSVEDDPTPLQAVGGWLPPEAQQH
jgi:hypothetical protein